MKRQTDASRVSEAGFTLVEILVAFAVSALVLVALYRISSTGMRAGSAAARYSGAVLVAESAMQVFSSADLLIPTEMHGTVDTGYQRDVRVRIRLDLLPDPSRPPSVVPYEVDVKVSWQDGVTEHSVTLSSLLLGAPE